MSTPYSFGTKNSRTQPDNIIVAIIDGTGHPDNAKYKIAFRNSFCVQISKTLSAKNGYHTLYQRGTHGLDPRDVEGIAGKARATRDTILPMVDNSAMDSAIEAFKHITLNLKKGCNNRIFLTGYSRGGLSVIQTAEMLSKENIKVEALFLFDAVNMTYPGGKGHIITNNVESTYHVRRSELFAQGIFNAMPRRTMPGTLSESIKYGAQMGVATGSPLIGGAASVLLTTASVISNKIDDLKNNDDELDDEECAWDRLLALTRSHPKLPHFNWGNCGREGGINFSSYSIQASHGGMGNLPLSYERSIGKGLQLSEQRARPLKRYCNVDNAASIEVATWMQAKMALHGLNVELVPNVIAN